MCYIVYQKSGKLADAAKSYNELRLSGNMDKAIEVYRKATGDTREIADLYGNYLPSLKSVWWLYNADMVIKQHNSILPSMIDPSISIHSERYAKTVCAMAKRLDGGEWDYYYEY
jgi:hypothetical protein